MDFPCHISFRHVPPIDAVADDARARAEHLGTFYDHILNCRVAIERPHHHHEHGNRYRVRIELAVPGELLVIVHTPDRLDEASVAPDAPESKHIVRRADEPAVQNRYLHNAIHDAFDEARRRLQDYARCRRGQVKRHEATPDRQAS